MKKAQGRCEAFQFRWEVWNCDTLVLPPPHDAPHVTTFWSTSSITWAASKQTTTTMNITMGDHLDKVRFSRLPVAIASCRSRGPRDNGDKLKKIYRQTAEAGISRTNCQILYQRRRRRRRQEQEQQWLDGNKTTDWIGRLFLFSTYPS